MPRVEDFLDFRDLCGHSFAIMPVSCGKAWHFVSAGLSRLPRAARRTAGTDALTCGSSHVVEMCSAAAVARVMLPRTRTSLVRALTRTSTLLPGTQGGGGLWGNFPGDWGGPSLVPVTPEGVARQCGSDGGPAS